MFCSVFNDMELEFKVRYTSYTSFNLESAPPSANLKLAHIYVDLQSKDNKFGCPFLLSLLMSKSFSRSGEAWSCCCLIFSSSRIASLTSLRWYVLAGPVPVTLKKGYGWRWTDHHYFKLADVCAYMIMSIAWMFLIKIRHVLSFLN